tara:strand:+ start:154 stop:777 length:624 start_codon:yes stop_codon:yes gene_type:complete
VLNNKIILVGYSGHGLVVVESIIESGMEIYAYMDLEEKQFNPHKIQYLGNEEDLIDEFWKTPYKFVLGIGDNFLRSKIAEKIEAKGGEIISVIHPKAIVSNTSKIEAGTFISVNSTINCFVEIGMHCVINTGSIIEHECIIGDNVHIAPGAVLAGNVCIGKNSFIGANAVIKQGVRIDDNVIVGAGTVVLNDVKKNKVIVGNPGREI